MAHVVDELRTFEGISEEIGSFSLVMKKAIPCLDMALKVWLPSADGSGHWEEHLSPLRFMPHAITFSNGTDLTQFHDIP
jgi:hypothetical protein